MKKILKIALLFVFGLGLVLPLSVKAAPGIDIAFDPTSAKVGDKVTLTIKVTDTPTGADMTNLYMTPMTSKDPEELEPYLKQSFNPYKDGVSSTYTYVWDTKTSGSVAGNYSIVVLVLGKLSAGQRPVLASSQAYSYTLTSAVTPKPSASTSGSGTTTDPASKNKSTTASAIGDFGQIIFPSTKVSSIRGLIVAIIDWLLILAGSLAVIAIIYSGLMYITAGADTTKAETAKKNLIWAIIGVVVISLALVIINTVVSVLGGNTGSLTSPTTSASPSPVYSMGPPLPPSPSPVYSMGPPLPPSPSPIYSMGPPLP